MNKREIGSKYEHVACLFLEQTGYKILERNYRTGIGEIDIIAREKSCLCFVEVKYRSQTIFGYPSEAVNKRKQNRIIEVALIYMKSNFLYGCQYRFDVVEILDRKIRLIRNCFGGN